mmetsp:Transcript_71053/g.206020  ORF Transcript_71053/g.206020 Transcript_71053/m.206020 type:complete len:168 (+) Transcript_71053:79-582(+)
MWGCCCCQTTAQEAELAAVETMFVTEQAPIEQRTRASERLYSGARMEVAAVEMVEESGAPPQAAPTLLQGRKAPFGETSPAEFDIFLQRRGSRDRLGVDCAPREWPPALLVKLVRAGLVEQWNLANPDRSVQKDDIITAVNGETSDVNTMLSLLASADTLSIHLHRR